MMKNRSLLLIVAMALLLSSCLKEEGTGGTSSISGKVYAYDYDSEMVNLRAQYYAPDEEVFIIYGDDSIPSDKTNTSYDGSYRFEYLRPGTYTLFVYSNNIVTKLPPQLPIKKMVEIEPGNQDLIIEDIEINK
jgi:hypothetical protein